MRSALHPVLVLLLAAVTVVATGTAAAAPPGAPVDLSRTNSASDLPDLGSPAATMLSHRDEYQLGAMVAHQIREQNGLLEDPEVNDYIESVGLRLASQSIDGGQGFHYLVVKDNEINSFAVSGGWVFMYTGLILASDTESQLAAVMAHETAHITQHHIARELQAQSKQSLTTAAALIAAILLGSMAGGGQATEGAIIAAQGIAVQQQINFSRDEEAEADRVGIGYLAGANFDPNAMAETFEGFARHEGLSATYIPAMLMDHPVTTDRIAEARSRAAQFPPRTGHDSLTFQLVRERVRVLTATGDVDIAAQYARKIADGEATLGNRYGQALALMLSNHPEEAARMFAELVKEHQELTMLYSGLGQAQAKAGHYEQALATFRHAEQLFPRNVPVTVRYAETLMADGKAAQAHSMLLDLFNNVEPTPDQIRLTALAASGAGDPGDAYYYMGEYQLANGDPMLAVQQYQLALASPRISTIQRERFRARLDEIRDYLASIRKAKLTDTSGGQGPGGGSGH